MTWKIKELMVHSELDLRLVVVHTGGGGYMCMKKEEKFSSSENKQTKKIPKKIKDTNWKALGI